MRIVVKQRGDLNHIEKFLKTMKQMNINQKLEKYGMEGVSALSAATPVDSGKTAASWTYEVHSSGGLHEIVWSNTNVNKGVNIAVILQTGHGTRNGGYVTGIDYINPALRPVFDKIADDLWMEVTSA